MKQIILITDGCSNVGVNPVVAAAQALAEGIVVNVVGIIDAGDIGELGAAEIGEIAKAGGGLSRLADTNTLSQTVQMMTRRTVTHTIQQAVGKELRHLLGDSRIEALPPGKRAEVVQVMEDMTENSELRIVLLIDASASMKPKIPAVREAIQDLMLSLQARQGVSELAVFHFPGKNNEDAEQDLEWTRDLAKTKNLFYKLNMKGTTPTGPAILHVVRFMMDNRFGEGEDAPLHRQDRYESKDGMLSDYIV